MLYYFYEEFLLENYIYKNLMLKDDFFNFYKSKNIKINLNCCYEFKNFNDLYKIFEFLKIIFKNSKIKIKKSKDKKRKKIFFSLFIDLDNFFQFLKFFLKIGFKNILKKDLFFSSFLCKVKNKEIWYFFLVN